MLIGTFVFSVFRLWLTLVKFILISPIPFIKIGFLWFSMAFAGSYIFFLLVHKHQVLYVRKLLALNLAKSLAAGLLLSSFLVALYEFVLQNVMSSKFFSTQHGFVRNLSLIQSNVDDLYIWVSGGMVLLSGLFATHFVGGMLDQWYEESISDRYGWSVLATTLICWGFLWAVNFVI